MNELLMHPASPWFLAALMTSVAPKAIRNFFLIAAPLLSFYLLSRFGSENAQVNLFGLRLIFADKLSLLFSSTFILFGLLANLYALHTNCKLILSSASLYVASSIGATLAGDFIILFIFWEIMAITSCFLILNSERPNSQKALFRYLLVHLTGGLFLISGILAHYLETGTLELTQLSLNLAGSLIFIGFAVNAGLPPLHSWLPDSYPEGTPHGSVFMSAYTTKVAVYVFARMFFGSEILIVLGAVAAVYGVIYALMENDMRKLLAYHIVCQVGYMLCGIGIGSELGINAGVGHAIGNILFKGLLFMATGAIIYSTGKYKLNELGGLLKSSKAIFVYFMIGAFAISGLPGLNGYVTKSLLLGSAQKAHLGWLEVTLTIVAAGTFLSIALKLAYFAFLAKPSQQTITTKPIPWNMHGAMILLAGGCFLYGMAPQTLLAQLPTVVHKNPFTASHIIHTLELLVATFLGFLLIVKKIHLHDKLSLDFDWFYRKGAPLFISRLCRPLKALQEKIQLSLSFGIQKMGWALKENKSATRIQALESTFIFITTASVILGIILFWSFGK